MGGQHFGARATPFGQQRQTAAHGALCIVFLCLGGAESSEQAVASVLHHLAAKGLNNLGTAREGAVHHGVDVLGVQVLRKRGRADHVEEKNADLTQRLGGLRGCGGWLFEELRAQSCYRRIDHRVAQQRTLCFKRGDAGEELLLGG